MEEEAAAAAAATAKEPPAAAAAAAVNGAAATAAATLDVAAAMGGSPKPEESIWSRIQASGILIPPEVIDKLAELDLELSEGRIIYKHVTYFSFQ